MSYFPPTALALAVVNSLRGVVRIDPSNAATVLTSANCNYENGGNPPPTAPEIYISVADAGASVQNSQPQNYLQRRARVDVFVSVRTGIVALDRVKEIYSRTVGSLDSLESQIIAIVHDKQAIREAAVALLPDESAPYLFPLWYQGRGGTEARSPSWSHETADESPEEIVGWLVRKLPFIGADRIEYSSEIV